MNGFVESMQRAGISTSDTIVDDGRLHRIHIEGDKPRTKNGWYVLHNDPPVGVFGCWKRGISEKWAGREYRSLSQEKRASYKAHVEAQARQHKEEMHRIYAECRKKADSIWEQAKPANNDHPYLIRKGVKAFGIRAFDKRLLVPVRDSVGTLYGLQYILSEKNQEGKDKYFMKGTVKLGHFHCIGGKPESILYLTEGYATAATVYEATGNPVALCFDCGNLKPVAEALRLKLPDVQIVVCADDDRHQADNPGLNKGAEAAQAVDALLAVPVFPSGAEGTDFNDLMQVAGIDEVKRQIEAAQTSNTLLTVLAAPIEGVSEPMPLPDDLLPVEPFDYALLPAAVRPWVKDVCERLQCPPDFLAVAVLAALGSLIGRKVGMRPQNKTPWTAIANQWALVVGRPGVMKSPALEEARAPLKRLEAQAKQAYDEALDAYNAAELAAELRKDNAKNRAKNELKKNPTADITSLLQVEELEAPLLRRYTANDTTPESLAELLRQNQNGVLVYRDEMVSLLKSLDDERNVSGRGFYITGWNGDSSYVVDRIGRGFNNHIEAVCISLLGGTQPSKLAEYVSQATNGGSGDDGLLQRFGLIVWPDIDREWQNVDRWPDSEAKNQAFEVFKQLAELNPTDIGADQDTDYNGNPDGIPYLRFSPEALELFVEWRTALEHRLRSDDLHPALESHFAKYRKLIPGLALIIHLADSGTGAVSAQATLQALGWSEYLESHTRRVYGSITSRNTGTAKEILKRINKGDLTTPFSSRDVWRPGWSKLRDRKAVQEALELLVDYQWLFEEVRETGGRPATIYHPHKRAAA